MTTNQRPRPVSYHSGTIVRDDADILVNTVNAVGVMGKGVALAFRTAFPAIMPSYPADRRTRTLTAGGCRLYPLPVARGLRPTADVSPQPWAALVTKAHWRDPSRIE